MVAGNSDSKQKCFSVAGTRLSGAMQRRWGKIRCEIRGQTSGFQNAGLVGSEEGFFIFTCLEK